jgi:hypothetical protein
MAPRLPDSNLVLAREFESGPVAGRTTYPVRCLHLLQLSRQQADARIVSVECPSRANPKTNEGSPIRKTLAFPHPIRCEPMPLDALDHLSNLVPSERS